MSAERAAKEQKPQDKTIHQRDILPVGEQQPVVDLTTSDPAALLQLQQTVGNRKLQRMLAARQFQAKLTVGEPDDQYEQEADQVAKQVMTMPDSVQRDEPDDMLEEEDPDKLGLKRIQRDDVLNEEDPDKLSLKRLQREDVTPLDEEDKDLFAQAKSDGSVPEVTDDSEQQINSMRGNGQALPDSAREFFEPRFGQDFSNVSIHTGNTADTLNRDVSARAFTTGSDIFFRDGEYNPESSAGRELLAHELTHVVQQGASVQRKPTTTDNLQHVLQRGDEPKRSFEQKDISYADIQPEDLTVPKIKTFWGTVPNALDDSTFESLGGFWSTPQMVNGAGELGVHFRFCDWRDTIYLNDQFLPALDLKLMFSQQAGHEMLTLSPGAVDYKPDGGGALTVVANYIYGGERKDDKGYRKGYHTILLTFIYSSSTSRTSGVSVEVGAEAKGASAKIGASSSTTVSDAALSFTRGIRFTSYEPGVIEFN